MNCPKCGEILKLKCKKCGHPWTPRKGGSAKRCPGCGRLDWDTFDTVKTSKYGCPKKEIPCQETCEHPHSQKCDSCVDHSNYK